MGVAKNRAVYMSRVYHLKIDRQLHVVGKGKGTLASKRVLR